MDVVLAPVTARVVCHRSQIVLRTDRADGM